MTTSTDVAVIGAGPYGLSVAAHLRALALDVRVFGDPLITWRRMLAGISLKSPDFGSNIYTPEAGNTFIEWCDAHGLSRREPIPMAQFTAYAVDTQQRLLPDVDPRTVATVRSDGPRFEITLERGERVWARRVVVATGLSYFKRIPSVFARLPKELVSHTSEHSNYDGFRGRKVVVVGAGQSAIEAADALLVAGADVTVIARAPRVIFTPVPSGATRGLRQRVRYPKSVIGEGWLGYTMQHVPVWPFLLPNRMRAELTRRHLGPYATWWLRDVQERARLLLRSRVTGARAEGQRVELRVGTAGADGGEQVIVADHVVCGTGFETDIDRIPFLGPSLASRIARVTSVPGAPRLSRQFESSVAGLFFVGPVSAFSFGPLFRFVCGAAYAAPVVARRLRRDAIRASARAFELG